MTILWLLPIAVYLHVFEEFVWPGHFRQWYQEYKPEYKNTLGKTWLLVINVVNVVGATWAAWGTPGFTSVRIWLAFAALQGCNAVFHLVSAYQSKKYSPGMVTGLLLYLPLAIGGAAYLWLTQALNLLWISVCLATGVLAQFLIELRHKGGAVV